MRIASTSAASPRPFKMVAVGDSVTAGMQDACLIGERQEMSYPAQIARQAGIDFEQPLITPAGIPPKIFLSPDSSLWSTTWRYAAVAMAKWLPASALALGVKPPEWMYQPLYWAGGMGQREHKGPIQNFAIPGFEARQVADVANVHDFAGEIAHGVEAEGSLTASIPLCRQILQGGEAAENGRTQVEQAVAQNPDLILLWAGGNDVLSAAVEGEVKDLYMTPMEDRKWLLGQAKTWPWSKPHDVFSEKVMPGLKSSMGKTIDTLLTRTSGEIMLMNTGDVTTMPLLFPLGKKVGTLPFRMILPGGIDITQKIEDWVLPLEVAGEGKEGRRQFPQGSTVALPVILKQLTQTYGVGGKGFSEAEVLDPQESAQVQKRIDEYNAFLADLARQNPRIHLVDINGLMREGQQNGIALRGSGPDQRVTTTFTGLQDSRGYEGFFSFDGVHPSDLGYAVIANQVLDKVRTDLAGNPRFTALVQAPPIDEKAVLLQDPHHLGTAHLVLDGNTRDGLKVW